MYEDIEMKAPETNGGSHFIEETIGISADGKRKRAKTTKGANTKEI